MKAILGRATQARIHNRGGRDIAGAAVCFGHNLGAVRSAMLWCWLNIVSQTAINLSVSCLRCKEQLSTRHTTETLLKKRVFTQHLRAYLMVRCDLGDGCGLLNDNAGESRPDVAKFLPARLLGDCGQVSSSGCGALASGT